MGECHLHLSRQYLRVIEDLLDIHHGSAGNSGGVDVRDPVGNVLPDQHVLDGRGERGAVADPIAGAGEAWI